MKKIIAVAAALVLALTATLSFSGIVVSTKNAQTVSLQKLSGESGLDLGSIGDSLVYDEDTRTMHYYYSLFGMLDNPDSLPGRTDGMRDRMLQALKNAGSMEMYKKAEMNFTYTYHSSSKPDTVLYEVTFRPSEYNK